LTQSARIFCSQVAGTALGLLQECAVTSADQALSLAEAWKIERRAEAKVPSRRA